MYQTQEGVGSLIGATRRKNTGREFVLDPSETMGASALIGSLLLGLTAGGFYLSFDNDFLLGQLAIPILGLSAVHGLWRGAFRKLVMLPLTLGVLYLVTTHPHFADPIVKAVAGDNPRLGTIGACVATVVLVLCIFGFLVRIARKRWIMRRPSLLCADRFLGTTLGLAEGAFAVLMLSWAAVLIEPQARVVRDHRNLTEDRWEFRLAAGVVQFADELDASPFNSLVYESNLLDEIPAMREALYDFGEDQQLRMDAIKPG